MRLSDFWVASGAGADVSGVEVGAQGDSPSLVDSPALPIGLFGIEEELLVERADVADGSIAEEKDRSDQEVSPFPQSPQPGSLHPGTGWGRERPGDSSLITTLGIPLTGGDGGKSWIVPQAGVQVANGVSRDGGVGVEEQHVPSGTLRTADGDTASESEVPADVVGPMPTGYPLDLWIR